MTKIACQNLILIFLLRLHEKIKPVKETQGVHEFVLHSGLKFQLYTVRHLNRIDSKKQQHDSSGNTLNPHNWLACEETTALGGLDLPITNYNYNWPVGTNRIYLVLLADSISHFLTEENGFREDKREEWESKRKKFKRERKIWGERGEANERSEGVRKIREIVGAWVRGRAKARTLR